MLCNKKHRDAFALSNLPLSQAGAGRHKCAGCAFEAGFLDGFNAHSRDFSKIVKNLSESQAREVRHRDPESAYNLGYDAGKNERG